MRPAEGQGRLFGPTLNPTFRLKAALRQAMAESRYSRQQIAERMNERAQVEGLGLGRGGRMTVAVLDAWAAGSKRHLPPAELIPLFCWAAESLLPLMALAECVEAELITGEERRLLEWARVEVEARRLARRRARLRKEIEGE